MPKTIKDVELVETIGSDGKTYFRTPCEIFQRCMGYIRPVENFNLGKKSEFYSRKNFLENMVDNSSFLKKWANTKTLEK